MEDKNKKNKEIEKFLLDFNAMDDETLMANYAKDRSRMADMMTIEPEEMETLIFKLDAYMTVMNDRKICHD